MRGVPPLLHNKQKREAMRNLYYLKDIALDAFESRKAELKGNAKDGNWFSPLKLHILPKLGCLPVSEIIQTKDTQYPCPHLALQKTPHPLFF